MLVSVVAESVRLVLTQYLMAAGAAPLHPLEGLFFISSACTAVLAGQVGRRRRSWRRWGGRRGVAGGGAGQLLYNAGHRGRGHGSLRR